MHDAPDATHEGPAHQARRDRESGAAVDVVIPIHDAPEDLDRCVASVLRHTSHPYRLVLIDDGSSDKRVAGILRSVGDAVPSAVVISHPSPQGFVRSVNEGFAQSTTNDVVILNSDTIVSARWLEKLVEAAGSRPNTATVTPLTNNGTICSVPVPFADNAVPAGYDIDGFAALVEATSARLFPEVPTGVGFCMLMTRAALDRIGRFDADAFGHGYGEENDFCQRAVQAGLVNLIADHTFVYHKGRMSFGARGDALIARHLARVEARHPRFRADVERIVRRHPLAEQHATLAVRGAVGANPSIARVLHLLHSGGGTDVHARDLAATTDPRLCSYVSRCDGQSLHVEEHFDGVCRRAFRFPLRTGLARLEPWPHPAYREALTVACRTLSIDLIHVHHLMFNTVDVAAAARELGIPYVVTLHDYYMVCPSYTLLNAQGQRCGACLRLARGGPHEPCVNQVPGFEGDLGSYQAAMEQVLAGAARVFAPSMSVPEMIAQRYPSVAERLEIIEHGSRRGPMLAAPQRPRRAAAGGRPLRVAIIGGLDFHKGAAVFVEILRSNTRDDVSFHLYGTTPDHRLRQDPGRERRVFGSRFVYHGPYERHAIAQSLRDDGIDVGLQLSIWPETFSFTLSEFVEAGIPVIAGVEGALGERVGRHRLGWALADIREPRQTLDVLYRLADDPDALDAVAHGMDREAAVTSLEAMWRTYSAVYHAVISPRPARQSEAGELTDPVTHYVSFLTRNAAPPSRGPGEAALQSELEHLRELLRSPRHRVADTLAGLLHRVPVLWPLVARITDAWVSRRQATRGPSG